MPYFYLFEDLGLPPSAHNHHLQHTQQHTYAHTQMHTYAHTSHQYMPDISIIVLHCWSLPIFGGGPIWESITLLLHFLLERRVFKCILRVCAFTIAQLLGVSSNKKSVFTREVDRESKLHK